MKKLLPKKGLVRSPFGLIGVFLLLFVISGEALSDAPDTLDLQLQWACSLTVRDFKLVDFDSDGISEILVGFYSDSARAGILDAVSETLLWESPGFNGSIHAVAAGDRNEDGSLDIVCGGQRSDSAIGYIEVFDGPDFDSVHALSGFDETVLSAAISPRGLDGLPKILLGTYQVTYTWRRGGDAVIQDGELYVLNGQTFVIENIETHGAVRKILVHDVDQDMNEEFFLGREYQYFGYSGDHHEWGSWIEEFTSDSCRMFGLLAMVDPSTHWTGHFGSFAVGSLNRNSPTFIIGSSYIDWWHAGYQDGRLACWNESTGDLRWSLGWWSGWWEHKWINDLAICSLDAGQTDLVCAVYHSGLTEFRDISDGSLLAISQLPYRTFQIEFGNVDNDSLIEICVRYEESNRFRVYEMPSMPTDVEHIEDHLLPEDFHLFQNYPNPFNPQTNIRFAVPVASNVKVTICNILGARIRTFEKRCDPGTHTIRWDGRNSSGDETASGIYLYKLSAGSHKEIRKMVLIR